MRGVLAEIPTLSGCFSRAKTLAELRKNVQIAVDLYLEDLVDPAG